MLLLSAMAHFVPNISHRLGLLRHVELLGLVMHLLHLNLLSTHRMMLLPQVQRRVRVQLMARGVAGSQHVLLEMIMLLLLFMIMLRILLLLLLRLSLNISIIGNAVNIIMIIILILRLLLLLNLVVVRHWHLGTKLLKQIVWIVVHLLLLLLLWVIARILIHVLAKFVFANHLLLFHLLDLFLQGLLHF